MGVTRIQHNLSAMNAMSNYQGNQNTLTGNLEKLSSGYRINSAADDAAGLAISEKMRSQIAGLEKAQDNANDGVSLIQTAEGALTEVNSMLTRLKTLATQSANGTYQDDVDRDNLQEETTALLSEIDRISQSTNFNGINLLDGSMSSKATDVDVSAMKNGQDFSFGGETYTYVKSEVTGFTVEGSNFATAEKGAVVTQGAKQVYKLDLSGFTDGLSDSTTFHIEINGTVTSVTTNDPATLTDTIKTAVEAFSDTAAGAYTVSISSDNGAMYLTAANEKAVVTDLSKAMKITAETDKSQLLNEIVKEDTDLKGVYDMDVSGLTNGTTYTLVLDKSDTTVSVTFTAGATGEQTAANFKAAFDAAGIANGSATVGTATNTTVSVQGSNITFNAGTANEKVDVQQMQLKSFENPVVAQSMRTGADQVVDTAAKQKLEFDMSRINVSGEGTAKINIGSNTYSVELKNSDSVDEFANSLVKQIGTTIQSDVGGAYSASYSGGKLVLEATNNGDDSAFASNLKISMDEDGFTAKDYKLADEDKFNSAKDLANKINEKQGYDTAYVGDTASINGKILSLQVGDTAKTFQQVNVDVIDMSVNGLGLTGLSVATQEDAAESIEKIQNAINTVSSQRGQLGALQNRLDHTLNNLDATTQNITAAESQIRDVDMAKEMTQYSKNNILVQAAQSMLAQANSLPQGVLSLLQ